MLEKGFRLDDESLSSFHINRIFQRLYKEVQQGVKRRSVLFEFIQDCAMRNLLIFLEACFNDPLLDEMSSDNILNDFWDNMLRQHSVKKLVKVCNPANSDDQLRPQSSLSSYYLIMGYYYFRKAAIAKSARSQPNPSLEVKYLDLAIKYGNFRAFVVLSGRLLRQLSEAFSSNQILDQEVLSQRIFQFSDVANKYGAVALLVMAKVYLFLSKYCWEVLEDNELYFQYYFSSYSQLVQAQVLSKMMTDDVRNALRGSDLRSFYPHPADSIELVVKDYRDSLLASGIDVAVLAMVENDAIARANWYSVRFYWEEKLSIESSVCLE